MKSICIVGMTLLVGVAGPGLADEYSKVGSVGAQFLKIGVGSRYQGLGEASVAMVDDAYSLYWNPAGLAYIENSELTFTNVNWMTDISINFIGFGQRIEDFGTIGIAATLMSMGDMEVTTVDDPEGTGDFFSATSFALTAGYARFLTTRLAFGASIKYIYENIYNESAGGIAFDFGTQLHTGFKSLRIGMNVANMGPELQFNGPNLDAPLLNPTGTATGGRITVEPYDLPLTFRLGMAWDLIDNTQNRWTVAAEARQPNDAEQQAGLGGEYCFREKYSLRAGYKFNYSEQGLTLGAGLQTPLGQGSTLVADYAWSDFGRFESVHRFSIGFRF